MPFQGIEQPDIIQVDNQIRLRKYDGNFAKAYPWYQDDLVRRFSEGITDPNKRLDEKWIAIKYSMLSQAGELYFIEVLEGNDYVTIGDVALHENNPPIQIGVAKYRGMGVGKKVMAALLRRAKEIGIKKIYKLKKRTYWKAAK